jgi:hypothetical protein
MPYEFVDLIKPQGNSQFALLEDMLLQGSYRVLQTEEEKNQIDPTTCKEGMLVKCLDSNKSYVLADLIFGEDEFGDPVVKTDWADFKVSIPNVSQNMTSVKSLGRWQLSIKTTVLPPGAEYKIKLPIAKAVILDRLEVDGLCDIKFEETNSKIVLGDYATFNNVLEHSFDNPNSLVYSNVFKFPDGTVLNTRYTNIFANKDPVRDKFYYYYVTNRGTVSKAILTKFLFISIHT